MKANRSIKLDTHGQSGIAATLGMMVAIMVAIIIGVLVFYELNDNLDPTFQSGSGTEWEEARATWNNTNDTAETVFSLLPIIPIILIAGIILVVVTRFGSTGGV